MEEYITINMDSLYIVYEFLIICHIIVTIYYNYFVVHPIENQLARFYNHENCTHFRRMDNTKLSLKACYVNLAVVPMSLYNPLESKELKKFENEFIRPRSSEELISDKSHIIKLKQLFDEKDVNPNAPEKTKRILIFGRAGIGKTTLCKKIVFNYYNENIWRNLFHRVIWLTLRDFKQYDKSGDNNYADLGDVFSKRFFNRRDDGQRMAEIISKEEKEGKRILYILDGWDEIPELLVEGHFMRNVLTEDLLKKPFLILTSRPYAMDLEPSYFDEILETVGFTQKNISKYVKNVIPDDLVHRSKVLTFINSHSLFSGIASIPIQLDMLCYLSKNIDDIGESIHTETVTMTKLYDVLVKKLMDANQARELQPTTMEWISSNFKNIFQIFQKDNNSDLSPMIFLAEVAYKGFLENRIEFNDKFFASACKCYSVDLRNRMKDSYFFNCLNPSEFAMEKKSYAFIHLTFQEFMAAMYIVNHLHEEETVQIICHNKYNPRFQILWPFVAGLIDTKEVLNAFFNCLESAPIEITGIPHQLLMINCINESGQNLAQKRLNRLLDDIWNWLRSGDWFSWHLGNISLPVRLYENMLNCVLLGDKDESSTRKFCKGYLANIKWLPDSIIFLLIDTLFQEEFNKPTVNPDPLVIESVQNILSYKYRFISVRVAGKIETILNDELNSPKRREGSLNRCKFLLLLLQDCIVSDSIYNTLLKFFDALSEDVTRPVHRVILVAISQVIGNSSCRHQLLERLTLMIHPHNLWDERKQALYCMRHVKKLPVVMQETLAEHFDTVSNEELNIRLQQQKFLSENVIDKMVMHLETNENPQAKIRCLQVLRSRRNLKEETLQKIFAAYQVSDSVRMKSKIIGVFCQQEELSETMANILLDEFNSDRSEQNFPVLSSSLRNPKLPIVVLKKLYDQFNAYHQQNNSKLLHILSVLKFKQLPSDMIESVYFRIQNSENTAELKEILEYLEYQNGFCNLPDFPLLLVNLLKKDDSLTIPIANILKRHQHLFLNENAVNKMREFISKVDKSDSFSCNTARKTIQVLTHCQKIPEDVLLLAIALIQSKSLYDTDTPDERNSRRKALRTLVKNQTKLSKKVILHLFSKSKWNDDSFYKNSIAGIAHCLSLTEILDNLDQSNWKDTFDNILIPRLKSTNFPIPVIQIKENDQSLSIFTPGYKEPQEIKYISINYAVKTLKTASSLPLRPDFLSLHLLFSSARENLRHIQTIPKKLKNNGENIFISTNTLWKYLRLQLRAENTEEKDFHILLEAMKEQLKYKDFLHVDLRNNHLRDNQLHDLKSSLLSTEKRIFTLILSENEITCSSSGLRTLLDATFCKQLGLKYLFLDRNYIYLNREVFNVTFQDVDSVVSQSGLSRVDISGNFIPEGTYFGNNRNILAEKHILEHHGIPKEEILRNVNFVNSSEIVNSCDMENIGFIPIHTHFHSLDIGYPKCRISKNDGCVILANTKGFSKHAFIGIDWVSPLQCIGFGQRQLIKAELLQSAVQEDRKHIKIRVLQSAPTDFIHDFQKADIKAVIFVKTDTIRRLLERIYESRDSADICTYKLLASLRDSLRGSFNCITWADVMLKECGITIDSMRNTYPILRILP